MKPGIAKGLRRLLSHRESASRRPDRPDRPDRTGFHRDQDATDFDPVEFAEFVAGDEEGPIPIDPVFKARLRAHLWSRLQDLEKPDRDD